MQPCEASDVQAARFDANDGPAPSKRAAGRKPAGIRQFTGGLTPRRSLQSPHFFGGTAGQPPGGARPVWAIFDQYLYRSKCGSASLSWHCVQVRDTPLNRKKLEAFARSLGAARPAPVSELTSTVAILGSELPIDVLTLAERGASGRGHGNT